MIFGKHINHLYLKYAVAFLVGIIALLFVDYLQLIIPEIIGSIVDGLKNGTLTESVLRGNVVTVALLSGSIVLGRFLWRIFIFGTSRKIDFDMRNELFAHAEELSERYYQENKTGGLMALFTNDLEAVRQSFAMGMIMFFDVIFLGGMAFYKMFRMDWGMTLLATIPLIMISLLAAFIGQITRVKFKARQQAFENMSDFTQENFYGIGVVKAFVNELREMRSFQRINQDNYDKNVAFIRAYTLMHVAIEVFITIIRIIIIAFGGYLVYRTFGLPEGDPNKFTVGNLSTYTSYFGTMVWPMMAIGRLINMRSQAKASLDRIGAFMDQPVEIKDAEDATVPKSGIRGRIEFNHLSFRYPGSRAVVLDDVHFTVEPGQTVGIIGRTGSGKTTLVDLMLRLYNLNPDQILVDGVDVMKWPIKALRDAIGYVPQDNFIFSDTVRNNIAFSSDDVPFEQVVDMAEKSDVAGNIEEFPDRYETIVGERGVTLSGGQKQRVSIARALIKDPQILIMDDSFSAVDTKTEEIILGNIKQLRQGKTTLIIAHRISTIKDADQVLVLDEGKLVARGTHEELLASSPLYKDMVLRQQLEEAVEGVLPMAKKNKEQYIDIDSIRLRKMSDWTIVKRLFAYVRPFYKQLFLAIFLVLVLVGLDLAGPLLFAEVLDSLGESPINFGRIILIAFLYFLTMVANAFLSYQQTMLLQKTGQKIIYQIREDVFNHVEVLSTAQFNKVPIGKLVTRVTSDTNSLNNLYTDVIVNLLRNSLTIIGVFIIMFVLNPRLSLYISSVIPFVILASVVFRIYARRIYRRVRYHVSGINAFLSEHLSGMRMIQIFNREPFKLRQFTGKNKELYKANYLQTVMNAVYRPIMYLLYSVGLFITLWVGAHEYFAGLISIGILFAFTQYIHKFFDPIQELAEQFDIMQSAFISGERIFEVLDTRPEIVDAPDAVELTEIRGQIEFRNVWFCVPREDWILKDVSFTVHPKETMAFVGATGSGKTTIMSLMVRNYDIQKGEILIDGVNVKQIRLASLRSRVGQMLQDVFLFSGTIESNIRMGDETLTEEKIQEAARYVNADRFIEKLPGKYQEPVRERGNNFSAGERQLMVRRTVIRKPSIMILDEATANIDTETEELIQESLKKMMNIGTMIIVAHRLSTIQHVNNIVVMQKGRIIESGTHQQLLKQKGQYYNLYRLQYDKKTGKKI